MNDQPLPYILLSLWVLNVLMDSGGQLAFKAAAADPRAGEGHGLAHWRWMARRPWIWVGMICYVIEFVLWLAFLSLVPLSDGVLLASMNIVIVMLAARVLFGEKLTRARVASILLISAGVGIVGLKL